MRQRALIRLIVDIRAGYRDQKDNEETTGKLYASGRTWNVLVSAATFGQLSKSITDDRLPFKGALDEHNRMVTVNLETS